MYLSRIEIKFNAKTPNYLHYLDTFHSWVEHSFPEDNGVRHLWRTDEMGDKNYLTILSPNKPDQEKLLKFGVPGTVAIIEYDSFMDSITLGQAMRFKLTANPTYKDSKTKRIFPHITVSQQEQWFIKKAEKSGFSLFSPEDFQTFKITHREWLRLSKARGRSVELSTVTFEGVLHVTDVDLFKKTLVNGIGREKAFGMGMLVVTPLPDYLIDPSND